jgi:hypothetical protein
MEVGNYRLYSVRGNPVASVSTAAVVPEPVTEATIGLGLRCLYVARRRGAAIDPVR